MLGQPERTGHIGTPAEEDALEFRRALSHFQAAAMRLSEAWDSTSEVEDYPTYLPSFDEFAVDVQAIRAKVAR